MIPPRTTAGRAQARAVSCADEGRLVLRAASEVDLAGRTSGAAWRRIVTRSVGPPQSTTVRCRTWSSLQHRLRCHPGQSVPSPELKRFPVWEGIPTSRGRSYQGTATWHVAATVPIAEAVADDLSGYSASGEAPPRRSVPSDGADCRGGNASRLAADQSTRSTPSRRLMTLARPGAVFGLPPEFRPSATSDGPA